jgi:hypothetical protein
MQTFVGLGTPISPKGFEQAIDVVKAPVAALWAVLAVETSGSGYLSDRRPKILFERHIFHRLTGGKFDAEDPDVSNSVPGGYGAGGAHQYLRLEAAAQLDPDAALQAASWGLGQVMGGNFKAAGFDDTAEMVTEFVESEDNQLLGMAKFIASNGIAQHLANQNWAVFARRYNGPNFAANGYDSKLAHFFSLFSGVAKPDLLVRAAQLYLSYRHEALTIDGLNGPSTIAAVKAFQTEKEVEATGVVVDALLALLAAQP